MFLDSSQNYNGDFSNYKNLFDFSDLHQLIKDSVNNFFNLDSNIDSLEDYEYNYDNGKQVPPQAFLHFQSDNYGTNYKGSFYLTQNDYGYFNQQNIDNGSLKQLLLALSSWEIVYKVKQILPEKAPAEATCYDWQIQQFFQFSQRSAIQVKLNFIRNVCSNQHQFRWDRMIWLHLLVFILSFIHFFLTIKYIFEIRNRYKKLKQKHNKKVQQSIPVDKMKMQQIAGSNREYKRSVSMKVDQPMKFGLKLSIDANDPQHQRLFSDDFKRVDENPMTNLNQHIDNLTNNENQVQQDWDKLGFWQRVQIINYWVIIHILSDFLIMSGTIIFIFLEDKSLRSAEFFIGFGCFFCWCSIPSYMHQTSKYSLINRTITYTLPIVLRAMIGGVPLFIGFVFLGLSLFWDSIRFQNLQFSAFSCFSMMQGDSLLDEFNGITGFRYLSANIYMYIFVFFGIVVVQNVFLIIIEHGFLGVKYSKSYDWLHQKYRNEVQNQFQGMNNSQDNVYAQSQVDQRSDFNEGKSYLDDGTSEFGGTNQMQRFQTITNNQRFLPQSSIIRSNSFFEDQSFFNSGQQEIQQQQLQQQTLNKKELKREKTQRIIQDLIYEESNSNSTD
ncbi:UNKNOWN [Stylonychia lemnae]|uniref:Polycystin cation channel PKD1/PKD2 domain-containing protein n=1 Tax=Stylonychia lemnae TaxID=5949 RepID=A0A078BAR5_STYLE|nr:UNKNOWN [Stylonychia lemnae]|eukprot:CDW91311.1 UNKNOWN [Stylonychia lemnae]